MKQCSENFGDRFNLQSNIPVNSFSFQMYNIKNEVIYDNLSRSQFCRQNKAFKVNKCFSDFQKG